jgi:hypothetical protein
MGNLENLERLVYDRGGGSPIGTLMPEELERIADGAGLERVRVWSEFMFLPDEGIQIGEDTERWERVVLELEMAYYDDPRFLGTGMLMLYAEKGLR